MKPGLYIQTTSCGEHDQHGPYKDEDERLEAARSMWAGETEFSQETDDIERLNVSASGHETLGCFSNGELEPDE